MLLDSAVLIRGELVLPVAAQLFTRIQQLRMFLLIGSSTQQANRDERVMCEVSSVIRSAIVCCIINLLNFLDACPETSCLLHLMIHLPESPPQPIPPMGAVLLNSAESLFTHKLKHRISVAPVPVHSEKQGNYLERFTPWE